MQTRIKSVVALSCLCLCLGLSSCQCSNKPDIGPVEDEEEAMASRRPASAPTGALDLLRT